MCSCLQVLTLGALYEAGEQQLQRSHQIFTRCLRTFSFCLHTLYQWVLQSTMRWSPNLQTLGIGSRLTKSFQQSIISLSPTPCPSHFLSECRDSYQGLNVLGPVSYSSCSLLKLCEYYVCVCVCVNDSWLIKLLPGHASQQKIPSRPWALLLLHFTLWIFRGCSHWGLRWQK